MDTYRHWFIRQHPFALASAVLSVFSLTHFGTLFIDEFLGIALGYLALRTAARGSVRLAYVGIVVGIISLICAIVLYSIRPG